MIGAYMKKIVVFLMLSLSFCMLGFANGSTSEVDVSGLAATYTPLSDEEMALIEGDGLGGAILCGTVATLGLVGGAIFIYATNPWLVYNFEVDMIVFVLVASGPSAAWKWGYNNLPF